MWDFIYIHTNTGIFCSVKNVIGNLIDCIESVDFIWQYSHFHNIVSFNPGAWTVSPSVYISLISFYQYLIVFFNSSFFSLGRFIHIYFILFFTVVKGISSLISVSDISLLIYWNASDSCVLTLNPMTLPTRLVLVNF